MGGGVFLDRVFRLSFYTFVFCSGEERGRWVVFGRGIREGGLRVTVWGCSFLAYV